MSAAVDWRSMEAGSIKASNLVSFGGRIIEASSPFRQENAMSFPRPFGKYTAPDFQVETAVDISSGLFFSLPHLWCVSEFTKWCCACLDPPSQTEPLDFPASKLPLEMQGSPRLGPSEWVHALPGASIALADKPQVEKKGFAYKFSLWLHCLRWLRELHFLSVPLHMISILIIAGKPQGFPSFTFLWLHAYAF